MTPEMWHELIITPSGRLALLPHATGSEIFGTLPQRLVAAFEESTARGLLHLATNELQTRLSPALDYARSFARTYLTRFCQTQAHDAAKDLLPTPPPTAGELATWILQAPPISGLEYLNEETLTGWWSELDALVREEIQQHAGGAQAYLSEKNPL